MLIFHEGGLYMNFQLKLCKSELVVIRSIFC